MSGRQVGPGHPCYVIAEAGSNHNRDLGIARKLIDVAADAGVDAVKFQTYSGRTLYSTKTPRFDFLDDELAAKPAHELLDEIALPREWQPILAEHCRERGVEFMSSPFDRQAVDELDALERRRVQDRVVRTRRSPVHPLRGRVQAPADPVDGHGEPG